MKVLHRNSQTKFEAFSSRSSLTIGNFDGCHLGHQALLSSAREFASKSDSSPTVLTFDPHPREFFSSEKSFPRLFQPEQKIRALAEQGVETLVIQSFDEEFSRLSPETFCQELVIRELRTNALTVGYDFRFGRARAGNLSHFKQFLPEAQIREIGEILIGGENVSSSAIRRHLQDSNIPLANSLLGRSYLLEGVIKKGRQLGRQLGFPTANIAVDLQMLPRTGVYCGWAIIEDKAPIFDIPKTKIPCIMNIGYRPTIEQSEPQLLVETHLLSGEYGPDSLYGESIGIYITDAIRSEKKFASLDELKEQIRLDCTAAKQKLGCR